MRSYYGSWEFSKFWRHFCLTSVGLLLPLHCLVLSLIISLTCQCYKGAYASADFPPITLQIILWNSNARNSPFNFSLWKAWLFLHLPLSPCQPALSQTCSKTYFLLQQRKGRISEFSVCTVINTTRFNTQTCRAPAHKAAGMGVGVFSGAIPALTLSKSKGMLLLNFFFEKKFALDHFKKRTNC